MGFTIRKAEATDMPQVLQLVKELAVFEKEADAVEVTVNDLVRDGFGEVALFHCFVGESVGESPDATEHSEKTDGKAIGKTADSIVGMALVYQRYSTWKGPVMHLEDLIVTERMRGSGLGSALLAEVVRYGSDLGVKRISWEVLDWNEPAIKFYESKGANVMRDWDVVQLDEEGMRRFLD